MQITSKDLRLHTKSALDAVRRGEKVEITFHGKVVALMVAPEANKNEPQPPEKLPGFGMWADKQEVHDTEEYIRNLRKPRYRL